MMRKIGKFSIGLCLMIGISTGAIIGVTGCAAIHPPEPEVHYPKESIEMIAPAGPGSGYDLTLRSVTQCLHDADLVSVPLPVTNKPGGGGIASLEYLDENKGRDNVLSVFSPPLCLIHLNGSTPMNYEENTTPIAKLVVDYGCFAVNINSPYTSINQVMDALKENPHALRIGGTSSEGSMDHIQFLKIAQAAGVERLNEITYEGFENGGVAAQLMGNRIDVLSAGISDVVGLMESGDLRVLAITSEERVGDGIISEIPTCKEQGIDAVFSTWRGIFGPKDMPEYAVTYWEKALEQMVQTKEWKSICEKYGWTMEYEGHDDFTEFLEKISKEYAILLDEIGMLAN
ncbi:MAG: tripartite tricarboxylate transporter substrate-binding protein [Clostridium sp.]